MTFTNAIEALEKAAYSDQCLSLPGHNTRVVMMAILVADGIETVQGAVDALEEIAEHELNKEAQNHA